MRKVKVLTGLTDPAHLMVFLGKNAFYLLSSSGI